MQLFPESDIRLFRPFARLRYMRRDSFNGQIYEDIYDPVAQEIMRIALNALFFSRRGSSCLVIRRTPLRRDRFRECAFRDTRRTRRRPNHNSEMRGITCISMLRCSLALRKLSCDFAYTCESSVSGGNNGTRC